MRDAQRHRDRWDGRAEEMERGEEIGESVSIHKKGADTGKGRDRIRRQVVPTEPPHPAMPAPLLPLPKVPWSEAQRQQLVRWDGGRQGLGWRQRLVEGAAQKGAGGLVQGWGRDSLGPFAKSSLCSPGWPRTSYIA